MPISLGPAAMALDALMADSARTGKRPRVTACQW
jgi:hypothetical protein